MLALRAGEFEGSEIGAHIRSCPKCRELLQAMSQENTVEFDAEPPDDGGTVGQHCGLSIVVRATVADSPQTIDRSNSDSSSPEYYRCLFPLFRGAARVTRTCPCGNHPEFVGRDCADG